MPEKEFVLYEEDFTKTMMDYLMFKQGIDVKEFSAELTKKVLYNSNIISKDEKTVLISISGKGEDNESN